MLAAPGGADRRRQTPVYIKVHTHCLGCTHRRICLVVGGDAVAAVQVKGAVYHLLPDVVDPHVVAVYVAVLAGIEPQALNGAYGNWRLLQLFCGRCGS